MRRAMYSQATVAYCGLTSSRAGGSRADTHPTLLSHNGLSAPATKCTDRSSSGGDRAASRGLHKCKCSDPIRGKKLGETMLLPILIFLLTLFPVLIPAVVT